MTRDEIISSLLDQAQDKDCLANNDETSIFTEDAKVLREAADLLKAQEQERQECYDTDKARIFSCSNCGYRCEDIYINEEKYEYPSINYCPNCGRKVKRND